MIFLNKQGYIGSIIVLSCIVLMFSCGGKKIMVSYDMSAEASFEEGMKLYDEGHYDKAIEYFLNVVTFNPSANIADDAQFMVGMSYYNMKKYEDAIAEFEMVISNFARSELVDDAYYYEGLSYLRLSPPYYLDQALTKTAIDKFKTVIETYQYSNVIDDAKKALYESRNKLARKEYEAESFYMRRGEYKSVIVYSELIEKDYYNTEWVDDAVYLRAIAEYKLEMYEDARTTITKLIEKYPDSEYVGDVRKLLMELDSKI